MSPDAARDPAGLQQKGRLFFLSPSVPDKLIIEVAPMRIIDVDSHFNEPVTWFEPANPKLAAKLPKMTAAEHLVDIIVGDLFSSVPPALRPDPLTLVPPAIRDAYEKHLQGGDPPQVAIDAGAFMPAAYQLDARVQWLDQRGIEKQILLPSNGYKETSD